MDKKCLPVRVPDLDGKVSLAAPLFGVLVFQGEGDAVVQRIVCVPARADGNIVIAPDRKIAVWRRAWPDTGLGFVRGGRRLLRRIAQCSGRAGLRPRLILLSGKIQWK